MPKCRTIWCENERSLYTFHCTNCNASFSRWHNRRPAEQTEYREKLKVRFERMNTIIEEKPRGRRTEWQQERKLDTRKKSKVSRNNARKEKGRSQASAVH